MRKMKFGIGKVAVLMVGACLLGASLMVLGEQHCSKKRGAC